MEGRLEVRCVRSLGWGGRGDRREGGQDWGLVGISGSVWANCPTLPLPSGAHAGVAGDRVEQSVQEGRRATVLSLARGRPWAQPQFAQAALQVKLKAK